MGSTHNNPVLSYCLFMHMPWQLVLNILTAVIAVMVIQVLRIRI